MKLEQLSEYTAVDEVSQWAIRDGERIVGGCTVVIYRGDSGRPWALLTGIHLEPGYRGKGLIDALRPLLAKYPQIDGASFFRKYDSGGPKTARRGVLGLRAHCAAKTR